LGEKLNKHPNGKKKKGGEKVKPPKKREEKLKMHKEK